MYHNYLKITKNMLNDIGTVEFHTTLITFL